MRSIRSNLVTLAAVGAAAVGGAAIASGATSTTSSSSSTTSSVPPSSSSGSTRPAMPAHGSASHEDAEKPVTGANAVKAKAAAVKAAGGGTATSVTTDFSQNGYEVDVKKSDGSTVEIHLDSAFAVRAGGPGGPGGMGRPSGSGPAGGPPQGASSVSG